MSNIAPIKGWKSVRSGAIALCIGAVCLLIAYYTVGGTRNWFGIYGVILDVIGAFVLVIPDLPKYREYFYAGKLRDALFKLRTDFQGSSRITTDEPWYDSFVEELQKIMIATDIPDGTWFEIRGDMFRVLRDDMSAKERMAFRNLERDLINRINEQEGIIRRNGVALLVIGFSSQLIGYLVYG